MRLRPVSWRVWIKPIDEDIGENVSETLASIGFAIKRGMDEDEIKRTVASDDVGIVMAIGPLAWQRQDLQGKRTPDDWEPWCKVGDKVIYARHAGKLKKEPDSGEWWYVVNDEDVISIIDPPDFSDVESAIDALEAN